MPSASPSPLRIVSGCPKGQRERLYAAHMGLVFTVLARFPFLTGEARDEAFAAGLLGLWQAAGRYDKSRGYTFGTYAGDYIWGTVMKHLTRERRAQRLPTVSLETPIGSGDSDGRLEDVIEDERAEEPGAALAESSSFEALVSPLPARQRELLRAMYQDDLTLAVVAEGWGLTRQRCGQMHLQALARLRKAQRQVRNKQERSGAFGSL